MGKWWWSRRRYQQEFEKEADRRRDIARRTRFHEHERQTACAPVPDRLSQWHKNWKEAHGQGIFDRYMERNFVGALRRFWYS